MCKPGDTSADIRDEARVLESREGVDDRRMTEPTPSSKGRAASLHAAIALVGLMMGIFVAPFFVNVRGVASLEATVTSMDNTLKAIREDMATIRQQVDANRMELEVGGRWTLEEELTYQSEHQTKQSEINSMLRERLAVIEYKNGITR